MTTDNLAAAIVAVDGAPRDLRCFVVGLVLTESGPFRCGLVERALLDLASTINSPPIRALPWN